MQGVSSEIQFKTFTNTTPPMLLCLTLPQPTYISDNIHLQITSLNLLTEKCNSKKISFKKSYATSVPAELSGSVEDYSLGCVTPGQNSPAITEGYTHRSSIENTKTMLKKKKVLKVLPSSHILQMQKQVISKENLKAEDDAGAAGEGVKCKRNNQPGKKKKYSEVFAVEFATLKPESSMINHQRSFQIRQLNLPK